MIKQKQALADRLVTFLLIFAAITVAVLVVTKFLL